MNLQLVIGDPNLSSWSLRPWLLLKAFDIHFETLIESLLAPDLRARLLQHSPTAKVPVLKEQSLVVWDSLAICEYLNDVHLDGAAWPRLAKDRAQARALACEMHSGFTALRNQCPMNVELRTTLAVNAELQTDLDRIDAIFANAHRSGWLFERFSIADCFFAPVAFRIQSYQLPLSVEANAYCQCLLEHPAMVSWQQLVKQNSDAGAPADVTTDFGAQRA